MKTYQEMIFRLKQYWADRGCIITEPYDVEVGAGTMCPETFLRVLGPDEYRVAYVTVKIPTVSTNTRNFRSS
jgi:glycyl-tRNA synthetase alpha chain